MPEAKKVEAETAAQGAAGGLAGLFADRSLSDKDRLRAVMAAMDEGRRSLDILWTAMGQSPDNGIELCKQVMQRHPHVPFVFYSRKITPENVVNVLQAGAADAIRKGVDRAVVLSRLQAAQDLYAHPDVPKQLRELGLNVNITIIPSR